MSEIRIRGATPADHAAYARLHPELEVPDAPVPADRWVATQLATTVVAERGAAVLGYAWYELLDRVGHIRNVVVAPEARGAGVGRRLMDALADRMRAAGAETWSLNVKPDNAAAIRLYERCGLRAHHGAVVLRVAWAAVEQLPEPAAAMRPIEPGDDAAVEAATGIMPGELAAARAKGDRVLVQLHEGDTLSGAAVFVPSIPGAFPFRVIRPALAGALLRALQPHALAEHDFVNVVCDDDPALAAALAHTGATEVLRVVHYRGAL